MQRPETAAQLTDIIRHAAAHDTPLRLVGNGTWQEGGGPFISESQVSLRALNGVHAYEPGDLVITVGAGTTLAELRALAGEAGQMYAASPYGTDDATIGACIATAAPAPLALGDLSMRDLVLGLTVITGTGETVRGGGRVVKNVAGFDLVRLHTGAWGTLGAITEVTLRLHAIPPVDQIVVGVVEDDLPSLIPRLTANRAPLPMVLQLAPGRPPELWARVSGNAARAEALFDHLKSLGVSSLKSQADTRALRDTAPDAVVLSRRAPLSDAISLISQSQSRFPTATLQYDPAKGALRAVVPVVPAVPSLRSPNAYVVPADAVHAYVVHQGRSNARPRSDLDAALKRAFDPRDICNRLAY